MATACWFLYTIKALPFVVVSSPIYTVLLDFMLPLTCNISVGVVVPMPTRPLGIVKLASFT